MQHTDWGELGPAQNFTGKAWNYGLVPSDTTLTTVVGNVAEVNDAWGKVMGEKARYRFITDTPTT